jgi:hypothetical protein
LCQYESFGGRVLFVTTKKTCLTYTPPPPFYQDRQVRRNHGPQ